MTRIMLVAELIQETRRLSMTHVHYLSTPREYTPSAGLFMREVHFVMEIDPETGSTGTEIANKLCVTLGAISQLATKLEKKGLITRSKSPEDKRQTVFLLTPVGQELRQQHIAHDEAAWGRISENLSAFDDEELKKIIEYEKIIEKSFRKALKKP